MNTEFRQELESLINKHSMENGSDTPDFILAQYLSGCLENFDKALAARETWYGRKIGTAISSGPTFETLRAKADSERDMSDPLTELFDIKPSVT